MKMELSEINHNYVTRVIVYSLFLHMEHRKDKETYLTKVKEFLLSRFRSDLSLTMDVGPVLSSREELVDKIERYKGMREEDESMDSNIVTVSFATGFKKMKLEINLFEPEKYEMYLYG